MDRGTNECSLGREMNGRLAVLASIAVLLRVGSADARTIQFSGMDWQVKNGTGGPNPNDIAQNYWSDSPDSIWVDDMGRLHLKIRYEDGIWKCAELQSLETMKYGDYAWKISNKIDNLDPNVVFGLFLYSDEHGHEYDIEFSRWGDAEANSKNVFYSCWGPGMNTPVKQAFHVDLLGEYTTHIMKWYKGGVSFASYYGHGTDNLIESWQPSDYPKATPDDNMRIHMNLWLNGERHPFSQDVQDIEIIINNLTVMND
jgi:hypothetical protein